MTRYEVDRPRGARGGGARKGADDSMDGGSRSIERRRGDLAGSLEFWDESQTIRGELLFIDLKISKAVPKMYQKRF
jgi:hypothetical protein